MNVKPEGEQKVIEVVTIRARIIRGEASADLPLRLKIEDGHESRIVISNDMLLGGLSPRDIEYFSRDIARQLIHHFNKLASPYRAK